MRAAFSLIELTVVLLITAIGAAVVVPKWTDSQSKARLTSAATALTSDIRALQRYAARCSQPLLLTATIGNSYFTVSPALPKLLGDSAGKIDYSQRYPGVVITAAPFNGLTTANINIRGELVEPSTGQPLSSGTFTLGLGGATISSDLLPPIVP